MKLKTCLFLALFNLFSILWSQDNRQQKLEAQRQQLKSEIKQINNLLFSNTKKKNSILIEVEDLAVKIDLRQRLIRVTNEEANRLNQQININQRNISRHNTHHNIAVTPRGMHVDMHLDDKHINNHSALHPITRIRNVLVGAETLDFRT